MNFVCSVIIFSLVDPFKKNKISLQKLHFKQFKKKVLLKSKIITEQTYFN